jgi:hypothetical protein|nr:MAG TPA: hypothetical protein [Caudoviricetes sp.]
MEIIEIVKDRVKFNEKLFSEKETELILDNIEVFSKLYLLGLLDKN